jgi:uncharacterized membrane protein (UPF0127 family)
LPIVFKSKYVIELCAGQIRTRNINKSDKIEIKGFS